MASGCHAAGPSPSPNERALHHLIAKSGTFTRLPSVRSAVPPSQGPRRDRKANLRNSLAGPREQIAHTPDCFHHPRLARVVLQLFAKLVDVRVERATRDAVRVAPYLA